MIRAVALALEHRELTREALADEVGRRIRAWILTEHLDGSPSAAPMKTVRLLPAFDQYVIGSTKHAVDLMPGSFRDRVHRTAGWVSPVLAVDGRFEGVWSHERAGTRLSVTIEPFAKQARWVRKGAEAEAEAERLAAFLGGSLELTWSGSAGRAATVPDPDDAVPPAGVGVRTDRAGYVVREPTRGGER